MLLSSHYSTLLVIHGIMRWFVLFAGIGTVIGCLLGIFLNLPFRPAGRILGLIYVSLVDTQFLVGVFLSIASPIVHYFWTNPESGMKSHDLRFFAVEHTVIMLAALSIAHIGAVRSRRYPLSLKAYKSAALWYAVSLVVIILGIPWWRPLLRH